MRFVHRFLCFMGLHQLPPGVQHQLSICWACHACGHITTGGLGRRR